MVLIWMVLMDHAAISRDLSEETASFASNNCLKCLLEKFDEVYSSIDYQFGFITFILGVALQTGALSAVC